MKKILVPVDFSSPSLAALDFACSLAKNMNSTVVALHIVESASSESFKVSGDGRPAKEIEKLYNYKLLKRSRNRLVSLVNSPRYASVKLDGELRVGDPFHGIEALIKALKIKLVVMGLKGRSRLEDMIVGSNTEKVIRCSTVPVLTIHRKPPLPVKIKNIVYATTLSTWERPFSSTILSLQKKYDTKLHLVYINTPSAFQQEDKVIRQMNSFAKKMKFKNYTLNLFSDYTEEEGIIHFSDNVKADMIAMSSYGHTGLAYLLAGSTAAGVMRQAKRPTLVYVRKK